MSDPKYSNTKVNKPWGSEYLIYENSEVALWLLIINKGENTSLHCHPSKKTGLLLLSGQADVDLGFYNTKRLSAPSKVMIRPGLFHSTKALSDDGIIVIELETPVDKEDLVRYKDEYGRQEKPYEGKEAMTLLDSKDIIFDNPKFGKSYNYKFNESFVSLHRFNNLDDILSLPEDTIIAVIEGGMVSKNGSYVLSAGDIVHTETVKKLAEVFSIKSHLSILKT